MTEQQIPETTKDFIAAKLTIYEIVLEEIICTHPDKQAILDKCRDQQRRWRAKYSNADALLESSDSAIKSIFALTDQP